MFVVGNCGVKWIDKVLDDNVLCGLISWMVVLRSKRLDTLMQEMVDTLIDALMHSFPYMVITF